MQSKRMKMNQTFLIPNMAQRGKFMITMFLAATIAQLHVAVKTASLSYRLDVFKLRTYEYL
jgi:hypothetical protein